MSAVARGRSIALLQGVYFVVTGLWPLLHIRSFLAVTGPKTDLWLVQAFGLLIAAPGLVLLWAARRAVDRTTGRFGLALAAVLCFIDCYYVAIGSIPAVYLADALVEAALAIGWVWAWQSLQAPASGENRPNEGAAPGLSRDRLARP
jgi:hypothetical protein